MQIGWRIYIVGAQNLFIVGTINGPDGLFVYRNNGVLECFRVSLAASTSSVMVVTSYVCELRLVPRRFANGQVFLEGFSWGEREWCSLSAR